MVGKEMVTFQDFYQLNRGHMVRLGNKIFNNFFVRSNLLRENRKKNV